jgi:uncharacterized protein
MNASDRKNEAQTSEPPEEEQDECFRVYVSKDKMRVLLDCDTEGKELVVLAGDIISKLTTFGVARPPSEHWVASCLSQNSKNSAKLEEVVLVEGMPPIPPVDGQIVWSGDFFNTGFERDENTDRVDFRRHAGQRNVKSEQLLATIVDPIQGENGCDVLGKTIRARKPKRCRIRLGTNIRVDEDTHAHYSTIDGRIRWNNDMLSVDDLYEISGDVGLETGDFSHTGAVLIQRDVLEGARIEAVGDIEVMGVIESAHVQTSGALFVHGGITGAEGSHVVAAGGIFAHYILDADVRAGEDIVVEREIVQSTVQTLGAVHIKSGRIVGGTVTALGGVDVGQIGSAASVPTEVVAGEDYCLQGRILIVRNKIDAAKRNVSRIHATIDPLRAKLATLPEKKKEVITTLLNQLPKIEAELLALVEEEKELHRESHAKANHTILIRKYLHPESKLKTKGEYIHVHEGIDGPVKPVYTAEGVKIAATHMRDLGKEKEDE